MGSPRRFRVRFAVSALLPAFPLPTLPMTAAHEPSSPPSLDASPGRPAARLILALLRESRVSLALALTCTLIGAVVFQPVLMGKPRAARAQKKELEGIDG